MASLHSKRRVLDRGLADYIIHPAAGIAQLVERNLAKVEVASSRLVSRSTNTMGKPVSSSPLFLCARAYYSKPWAQGAIAKRLCTGLQIRVGRFDSGSRLQKTYRYAAGLFQAAA